MKKPVISILLFTVLLLTACQQGTNEDVQAESNHNNEENEINEENNEVVENEVEEETKKSILQTADKETLEVSKLEKAALHIFEGEAEQASFTVYLYDANERKEENTAPSFIGNEGDLLVEGNYDFYLSEADDELAYKQDHLESLSLMRNLSEAAEDQAKWTERINLNNHQLFTIYEDVSMASYSPHIYTFHEGELHHVPLGETEILQSKKLKPIGENRIQTVHYDNSEIYWFYRSFLFDEDNLSLDLISERAYKNPYDNGIEPILAEEFYDLWHDYDKFHIMPIHHNELDWWVLDDVLKNIDQGQLGDIPVKLGDEMYDFFTKHPQPIDYIMPDMIGGMVLDVSYGNYSIAYGPTNGALIFEGELDADFHGKVSFISIKEPYINFTLDDVFKKLGAENEFIAAENNHLSLDLYIYQGKNDISFFFAENPDNNELSFYLFKGDINGFMPLY